MEDEIVQEQLKAAYLSGKQAFERGRYRESVNYLETAAKLMIPNSKLGGEVQIWLATAYEAVGQRPDSIALYRSLSRHPHGEIRKQSRRLLYILEAPRLSSRPDWVVQIPDLAQLDDSEKLTIGRNTGPKTPHQTPKPPQFRLEPERTGEESTGDNWFVLIAFGIVVVILGGMVWFN
ncbi:MAG: hypothetical protein EBV05_10350 [Cyanobacteria bacterium WB6_1B_304]|nr:hypothetical protein [Cyanobacteria bacterium WB6_1B_304]